MSPDQEHLEDLEEFGTPWRRDLDEIASGLKKWASQTMDGPVRVSDISSPGNGMSSETVLFTMQTSDGTSQEYAARHAPLPELVPVFREYDLALQARCMKLARAHTDVPAPDVHWMETDHSWLGGPFLVMPRIHGDAPQDVPPYVFGGWVADAAPEERARMQRNAVSVLARLHMMTPDTVDLSFLDRPHLGSSPLDQQLAHEHSYYEWARDGVSFPVIERAFAWLHEHRPEEVETVFNWGDARIGNMLFRDFEVVGVLDWEMATYGPREVDLAWMIFLHRFFQDLAGRYGFDGLPTFMSREGVATDYEELSGRTVRNLEWFEVFAALRFAIVSVRTTTRGIAYGTQEKPADPDDYIMFRGLMEQMFDGTYWS
jgi:aminoglycoside phosphotransferase (APT) family kinase protein